MHLILFCFFLKISETINLVKIIEKTGVKALGVHGRLGSIFHDVIIYTNISTGTQNVKYFISLIS